MRQPQATNASCGISRASGMNTAAAKICPACTPCNVKEDMKPRRPNGACSSVIDDEPEISPATAKPCTRRRITSSTGASTPTCE